jgi:hypothetical protein
LLDLLLELLELLLEGVQHVLVWQHCCFLDIRNFRCLVPYRMLAAILLQDLLEV